MCVNGVVVVPVATEVCTGIFAPLVSISRAVMLLMPPAPLYAPNDTVAIWPLPKSGLGLTTAILIDPGMVVFDVNNAPETRLPCITEGEAKAGVSYPRVSCIPDTPYIPSPSTTYPPPPDGDTVIDAATAGEQSTLIDRKTKRAVRIVNGI